MRRLTPLVRKVAGAYYAAGHEDDLVQVAWLGLVKAIDRYDPAHGASLRSYALPTMYGEVRRYLRDFSWSVHVPRPLQERVLAVTKTIAALSSRDGRPPTAPQVAQELGLDLEDVLEALQASHGHSAGSLDAPVAGEPGATVGDMLGADDAGYALTDDLVALRGLRGVLDDREQQVIYLRFYEDLTQTQIAARVGCSQMQVSRVLRHAITRLNQRAHAVDATD